MYRVRVLYRYLATSLLSYSPVAHLLLYRRYVSCSTKWKPRGGVMAHTESGNPVVSDMDTPSWDIFGYLGITTVNQFFG